MMESNQGTMESAADAEDDGSSAESEQVTSTSTAGNQAGTRIASP